MISPAILLQKLPYTGQNIMHVAEQKGRDIERLILDMHGRKAKDYDAIASSFWRGTAKRTARYLFEFCKYNMKYHPEGADVQNVKAPSVILLDAAAGRQTDCKHYASFIAGVCDALARQGKDIGVNYIFCSDWPSRTYAAHVFAEVTDSGGGRYWTDPVLSRFDKRQEYPYYFKRFNMLQEMNGAQTGLSFNIRKPFGDVGDFVKKTVNVNSANLGKDVKKAVNANLSNLRKGAKISVHNVEKGAANTVDKTKQVVLSVALATQRNAALFLISKNIFGYGVKITNFCQTPANRDKLKRTWEGLGGKWSSFASAVNKGWRITGKTLPASYHQVSGAAMNGDPVTVAAIAAAGPIIAALAVIIHDLTNSKDQKELDVLTNRGLKELADGAEVPEYDDRTNPYSPPGSPYPDDAYNAPNSRDTPPGNDPPIEGKLNIRDIFDNIGRFVAEHSTEIFTVTGIGLGVAALNSGALKHSSKK